ncbi:MAG: ABC transporter ATP-binding protein/permease [Acetatifactor sp.]|nr:ABC transporter ATP-binding protein/permease [Acetatifactor sp.]
MYHYITRKKAHFALLIVLLVINGSTGVCFSLVMSSLVDCAGGNGEELPAALAVGVAYVAFYTLIAMCYRCWKASVIADARRCLKRDIFGGIMRKSVADFNAGNSGEYINELSNNMNLFEEIYFNNIVRVLECLISFATAAVICIKAQPLMLVLMLFLAFVTLGVTKLTAGMLEKSTETFAKRADEYMAETKDDFGAFRMVRSFGILDCILDRNERKNALAETAKRKNESCMVLCSCTGQLVGLLSTVLVMAMAAWFSLQGLFSAGMVIAFGHLIGQIVSPVTAVPGIVANFRASKPLQARFQKLMAKEAETGTECVSRVRDAVVLEKLHFGYQKDREALHGLSFRFQAGGRYAIVGSSGSGKSTLLSLLMGDYPDYDGRILYDGTELRNLSAGSRSTLIGVVSQDVFLLNDTVRNNITLYGEYTQQEIDRAVEEAGLKEFADSLPEGLLTMVDENGKNFSGGEKQRISLARVILRKSRVLLLDEFTANLDERTAEEIERRLLLRKDCLIIAVTHRLNPELLRQYDGILIMSHGQFAACGTYDELQKENFKEMLL